MHAFSTNILTHEIESLKENHDAMARDEQLLKQLYLESTNENSASPRKRGGSPQENGQVLILGCPVPGASFIGIPGFADRFQPCFVRHPLSHV